MFISQKIEGQKTYFPKVRGSKQYIFLKIEDTFFIFLLERQNRNVLKHKGRKMYLSLLIKFTDMITEHKSLNMTDTVFYTVFFFLSLPSLPYPRLLFSLISNPLTNNSSSLSPAINHRQPLPSAVFSFRFTTTSPSPISHTTTTIPFLSLSPVVVITVVKLCLVALTDQISDLLSLLSSLKSPSLNYPSPITEHKSG